MIDDFGNHYSPVKLAIISAMPLVAAFVLAMALHHHNEEKEKKYDRSR